MKKAKNPAAVALGKLGGAKISDKKRKSSAENGKKGGRPKKISSQQELKRLAKAEKRSMASYVVHTLRLSKQSGKESKNG